MLVDGDPKTGWAEGAKGVGIGVEVVVPMLLDPSMPVSIWAGYGKSAELFAANGRPKRVGVTVLRLKADQDYGSSWGFRDNRYVEPVMVAGHHVTLHHVTLLDFNGYQTLPVPPFRVEHYLEYPSEWLKMDGTERWWHQQRVDAGQAEPFRQEFTEYAYLLSLRLLDVYPGTRYEDTVISQIGYVPPIEGITWFAEFIKDDIVLEEWQIIVEGDSGGPVLGRFNIWLGPGDEVEGFGPELVTGTYIYPDVKLSWSIVLFDDDTLSCKLTGVMAPAGDSVNATVVCVPDKGTQEITRQLRFNRTYG